jgi:polysaccharide pyruvyl transferase WcaK-like protein
MPNVLLLNDNADQPNWGAHATPYALKRMLHDHIAGLSVTSFSYSWLKRSFARIPSPLGAGWVLEVGRWPRAAGWAVRSAARAVSPDIEVFPEVVDDWDDFADEWMRARTPLAREFLTAARQADVVVHNGENGLYKNSLTGCRALFLIWLAKTRLGKPACEINATAHLTPTRPIMPGMLRAALPILDVVTTREPCSCRNLRAMGFSHVETVPDVVFYLNEMGFAQDACRQWRRRAGVEGRPYFCLSAGSLPMSRPRGRSLGAVAELVMELKRVVPQAVLLARDPHCLFLKDVATETQAAFFGPDHTFHELWPLLRESRFLVTGHYHYAIMAGMVGCPFIPLSTNNHKMSGACELMEWSVPAQDSTALRACTDVIRNHAVRFTRDRDRWADHLTRVCDRLRNEAARNAVLIEKVIAARSAVA